jgi:hypothetical protein
MVENGGGKKKFTAPSQGGEMEDRIWYCDTVPLISQETQYLLPTKFWTNQKLCREFHCPCPNLGAKYSILSEEISKVRKRRKEGKEKWKGKEERIVILPVVYYREDREDERLWIGKYFRHSYEWFTVPKRIIIIRRCPEPKKLTAELRGRR